MALKLALLQHSGGFKVRGAFDRLLAAEVFVPFVTPPAKVFRLARYGAHVVQVGANYAEALAACRARQAEIGALDVRAYDDADVVSGQGMVGVEFKRDAGALTHVLAAEG